MEAKRGFSKDVVAAIRDCKILGIRADTKPHRIIGIWAGKSRRQKAVGSRQKTVSSQQSASSSQQSAISSG